MMDAFSSTVTRGLQHGVPLDILVADYVGTRFEPSGPTNDPEIKQAGSVMDYVGRRLALDYLPMASASAWMSSPPRNAPRNRPSMVSARQCGPTSWGCRCPLPVGQPRSS
ncbi:hypothetical protein [Streptomyces griseorubiginosus]|uniref:hypothetical protein n=1 Tax=Streptomyces griseorubiginosus TaxID=67304 RepID=UPI001AD71CF4|nr:hypothetical protein [Streptomyces griseorubiginosus]